MKINICEVCGTENEEEYKFCKNCGNPVNSQDNSDDNLTIKSDFSEGAGAKSGVNFTINDFDGVSDEEMAAFIGKKSHTILPKFSKMQITGSKVSWCWPVAVLGYLLGPMGSALWFFYRKMYKPAILLSVIGAVVIIVTSLMSIGSTDTLKEAFSAIYEGDYITFLENLEKTEQETTILTVASGFISEFVNIASALFSGIFGFYIYKKHCTQKIIAYRSSQADKRYYKMGLVAIGGVSGGMLGLGILAIVCAENIASFLVIILSLLVS